jgi:starch-binding outer membrane protein, SusD/RagB family
MKRTNIITLFRSTALIFVLMISTISCEDLLDVQPRNSVSANGVLSSPDAVQAAVNSTYARLRDLSLYGRNMQGLSDALADMAFVTRNSGRLINENLNVQGTSTAPNHFTHWAQSYFAINEININLKAIAENTLSPTPTQAQLDKWNSELRFLRALYYHNLVKAYAYDPGATVPSQDKGGVPLMLEPITTSGAATTALSPRAPVADVYTQIYKDLNDAIAIAPTTGGPFFATKAAAHALLSRVALFNKDYATVVSNATAAIAATGPVIAGAAYVNGFRASQNPESIFEVKFQDANEAVGGVNESNQSTFTSSLSLSALTSQGGWGDLAPNTPLRTLLGITGPTPGSTTVGQICTGTDIRVQLYAIGPGRGSGPKVESIKFIAKNGIAYLDNALVIRRSEMLLNRAEAYATPGSSVFDEALALADLNLLLVARGLTAVSLTGSALYEEILKQRRIEFAFEGHRWFDLKRLGRDVIKEGTVSGALNVPFTDQRILPAIPQREIDANPNLVQNTGY